MKITRSTVQSLTSWDYVGIGQTFVERPGGPVFLKTADIFEHDTDHHYNSVNLETGELVGFMSDCEVLIVKSELTVEE
jgi:hypothetical protein